MDSARQASTAQRRVMVLTREPRLAEHILAVCAAADVEAEMLTDPAGLRGLWSAAALVIVGMDQAEQVVELTLPHRPHIYLVDDGSDRDPTGWSVRLGAAVVALPAAAPWLVNAVVEATRLAGASGRVVAVVGGSGGVGASTVAAALAVVGARQGSSVMLVDTDPLGGGLDLMIGAERVGGWRWPRLATARGHLGDLSGQVPHVDGVDVVSMGRGAGPTQAPGFDAARAVLLSAGRSHDLVIVDVGRALWGRVSDTLRMADLAILLAHAGVRGIAAGRQTLGWLEEQSECWGLLLRQPRAGGLRVREAAEAFDLPLIGSIADDPAIAVAAELGEPPARAGRSQLARACVQVLAAAVGRGPVVE